MHIVDSGNVNIVDIRAKARRMKTGAQGLSMIIVDYLQLMTAPNARRPDNRQQEVAEICRSLKLLAKELDIPVIALSQLNRNPEARADKRPQLSDLRESGAIEQDSDLVMFIHRDDPRPREEARGRADHREAPQRARRATSGCTSSPRSRCSATRRATKACEHTGAAQRDAAPSACDPCAPREGPRASWSRRARPTRSTS